LKTFLIKYERNSDNKYLLEFETVPGWFLQFFIRPWTTSYVGKHAIWRELPSNELCPVYLSNSLLSVWLGLEMERKYGQSV
jgi:hypothetical protein